MPSESAGNGWVTLLTCVIFLECNYWPYNADQSAATAADSIIAAVKEWSARQDDDLTILICDFGGGKAGGGMAEISDRSGR